MKTLSELYRANTLSYSFDYEGIELVAPHKVSYKTMQALGRIMSNISINAEGDAAPQEMVQTLMGKPSQHTRETIIRGLGSHYDKDAVQKTIAGILREEGEINEGDIVEATITVMLSIEDMIVSDLFSIYLDNQDLDSQETPR